MQSDTEFRFNPNKLDLLRDQLRSFNLHGYLLPQSNLFRTEQLPPHEQRLAWQTGFTGSAGFAVITLTEAAVFVDGRYTIQANIQVDTDCFQIIDYGTTAICNWLKQNAAKGDRVGFCGEHSSIREIELFQKCLSGCGIEFVSTSDLVGSIWTSRSMQHHGEIYLYPEKFAGECQTAKRHRMAQNLKRNGLTSLIISNSSSVSWLLNIRGTECPLNPVVQSFAILYQDSSVDLFTDSDQLTGMNVWNELTGVSRYPVRAIETALDGLDGTIQVDPGSLPYQFYQILGLKSDIILADDPVEVAKATKNPIQIGHIRTCHIRDGASVIEFLSWLDSHDLRSLTELDVIRKIERFRRRNPEFRGNSFDTIAGSGPHGAIVHYRADQNSNRALTPSDLLLIDSGAHYVDGTTDITRTVALGSPTPKQKQDYTFVLKALIALSRARWPAGTRGRALDAIARCQVRLADADYKHGTGHGVGQFMDVHEAPYSLAITSDEPIPENVLMSVEPGIYRADQYGIRLENLALTVKTPAITHNSENVSCRFETVSFVPFDRRMIDKSFLEASEIDWINHYHSQVLATYEAKLSPAAQKWLKGACQPI